MPRLMDVYTVTLADLSADYIGRGFNPKTGQWRSITGTNLGASLLTKYRLTDAQIVVTDSSMSYRNGVVVSAFVVHDPSAPDWATAWFQGVHSQRRFVFWHGRLAMGAGFYWRINTGGLNEDDIVTMAVGYE